MTDEKAAYHEAGHAIAALKLGYECRRVSIIIKNARGDREGACCQNPMRVERGAAEQRYEHRITILLAGDIAEKKANSHSTSGHDGFDKADVYNSVIEYLGKSDPLEEVDAERRRIIEKVRPVAQALVQQHWDSIQVLAGRLQSQRTVDLY